MAILFSECQPSLHMRLRGKAERGCWYRQTQRGQKQLAPWLRIPEMSKIDCENFAAKSRLNSLFHPCDVLYVTHLSRSTVYSIVLGKVCSAQNPVDAGQELQFMFTSNITAVEKNEMCCMTAGVRQWDLSVSETAVLLGFSHTSLKWCEKKHP